MKESIVQMDIRQYETIRRIRKAFNQQNQAINAMALKPHDSSCKDILNCDKLFCFERVADKIVSDSYAVGADLQKILPGTTIDSDI